MYFYFLIIFASTFKGPTVCSWVISAWAAITKVEQLDFDQEAKTMM